MFQARPATSCSTTSPPYDGARRKPQRLPRHRGRMRSTTAARMVRARCRSPGNTHPDPGSRRWGAASRIGEPDPEGGSPSQEESKDRRSASLHGVIVPYPGCSLAPSQRSMSAEVPDACRARVGGAVERAGVVRPFRDARGIGSTPAAPRASVSTRAAAAIVRFPAMRIVFAIMHDGIRGLRRARTSCFRQVAQVSRTRGDRRSIRLLRARWSIATGHSSFD